MRPHVAATPLVVLETGKCPHFAAVVVPWVAATAPVTVLQLVVLDTGKPVPILLGLVVLDTGKPVPLLLGLMVLDTGKPVPLLLRLVVLDTGKHVPILPQLHL